jgi:hypothetical protein
MTRHRHGLEPPTSRSEIYCATHYIPEFDIGTTYGYCTLLNYYISVMHKGT